MKRTVISAALLVNFHREQRIALRTLRFVGAALKRMREHGRELRPYFVLDRADEYTRTRVRQAASQMRNSRVIELECGNLGTARATGVSETSEDLIFFLDGDDFVSFNWFPEAMRFFDRMGERGANVIAHTQFYVGFDREQFVRLGVASDDPAFDPLALAADWFFCNNLACHRSVFEDVPIQPYDHASGFGAEDWHWSCETIARGYAHQVVPHTAYFYRIKPRAFSLGAAPELVPKASALFESAAAIPAPCAEWASELPPLDEKFFRAADELVPLDAGLSYLRTVQAGQRQLHYFRPSIPPGIGQALRQFQRIRGNQDAVRLVYADLDRIPGGIPTLENVVRALSDGDVSFPMVIVGDGGGNAEAPDHLVSLDALRRQGCTSAQVSRIVARMFIQTPRVSVYNFISPAKSSFMADFAPAKSHTIRRWLNIVMEYGWDVFSGSVEQVQNIERAGVESRTCAIFGKTAEELSSLLKKPVFYSRTLERMYESGNWTEGSADLRALEPRRARTAAKSNGVILRTADGVWAEPQAVPREGRVENDAFVLLAGRHVRPCNGVQPLRRPSGAATIFVPALVVKRHCEPTLYFRPDPHALQDQINAGKFPHELLDCEFLGIGREAILRARLSTGQRIRISELLTRCFEMPQFAVSTFGPNVVVVSESPSFRKAEIMREILGSQGLK